MAHITYELCPEKVITTAGYNANWYVTTITYQSTTVSQGCNLKQNTRT